MLLYTAKTLCSFGTFGFQKQFLYRLIAADDQQSIPTNMNQADAWLWVARGMTSPLKQKPDGH